jgi:transposase
VIEVVPAPVSVTEHQYLERRCPQCGGRWLPGPELAGVVVGQGRLGIGMLSLIAVLREELRLPIATIQRYVATVHGLALSVGAIVGALHVVAQRAVPVVVGIQEAIRASPVLHADETGWREDGHNGYVWTFSTTTQRAFVRDSRARRAAAGDRDGLRWRAGERFLCRLHRLRGPASILLGASAARCR